MKKAYVDHNSHKHLVKTEDLIQILLCIRKGGNFQSLKFADGTVIGKLHYCLPYLLEKKLIFRVGLCAGYFLTVKGEKFLQKRLLRKLREES